MSEYYVRTVNKITDTCQTINYEQIRNILHRATGREDTNMRMLTMYCNNVTGLLLYSQSQSQSHQHAKF